MAPRSPETPVPTFTQSVITNGDKEFVDGPTQLQLVIPIIPVLPEAKIAARELARQIHMTLEILFLSNGLLWSGIGLKMDSSFMPSAMVKELEETAQKARENPQAIINRIEELKKEIEADAPERP